MSTTSYEQWVVITIINSSAEKVVVKNVSLSWGKFYKYGEWPSYASVAITSDHSLCVDDKDVEIPASEIENTEINPGHEFKISSCGRSGTPSGTEGQFDIYENKGDKVRHFYWACPWAGANKWGVTGMKHLLRVDPPEQVDSQRT